MEVKNNSFYEDATSLLNDSDLLRVQAQKDGYLFFKNFLDKSIITDLRFKILNVLNDEGFLHTDFPLMNGIADLNYTKNNIDFRGSGIPQSTYFKIQKLELFNSFPHQKKLIELFEHLMNCKILVHPGHIGRIIVPTGAPLIPIPPHQDHIHVKGTVQAWTCWTPLGDVSRKLGSLCILRGSSQKGMYPIKPKNNGGMESILTDLDNDWVSGDFEMGDILIFSSLTIHRALANRTKSQIRLSMDFRYQPIHEPISQHTLMPHDSTINWDEIYKDWERTDIKYYWKKNNLNIVSSDAGKSAY